MAMIFVKKRNKFKGINLRVVIFFLFFDDKICSIK